MVPLFEEMEACRFSGYTWRQWRELDPLERGAGVAHHRVHLMVENHKEDAVADRVKAETEKGHA